MIKGTRREGSVAYTLVISYFYKDGVIFLNIEDKIFVSMLFKSMRAVITYFAILLNKCK